MNDVRWTQGTRWTWGEGAGGEGPHSNNVLDFVIEHSIARQDPRIMRILHQTGKKLTLRFTAQGFVFGHGPLRPLTERKPKNKKRGRPGNEATDS